jgi:hypothetical protein
MQSKRARWQAHVEAWGSSGLSQSAYCRRHGLSLASFGYWRRRLAGDAVGPRAGVLPIQVEAPVTAQQVQVRLPNGLVLTLPLPADAAGLQALLRSLCAC